MTPEQVGQIVRNARKEKGLSQKALSELVGVDQSEISRLERGERRPSEEKQTRIAEALGVGWCLSIPIRKNDES